MSLSFLEPVHANPWSEDFADLASLNAKVGDAIEAAIRTTREVARNRPSALRSASVTVLGPAGAGKTHLFGRLRRRLGPRAVFVHIRPLLGVEMTHRFILHEIVRQLGFATGGLRQVDALVGSLLAHLQGSSAAFPHFFVEDYAHLDAESRNDRLERDLDQVLSTWQELDEVYLRRLLSVPFQKSPVDRALLAWLSGRELDVTQLSRIGAGAALGEEIVIPALKTLAATACVGAPIVIVFDQLENLVDREMSSSRLLAYAQLTTDLIDTVHGVVVVQLALDTEWERSLLPSFNLAQRSRLTMETHLLGLPSEQQKVDLLRLWLERFPDRSAPFPWPLSKEQVERLCGEIGTTPRMLLIALGHALQEGPPKTVESAPPGEPTLAAPAATNDAVLGVDPDAPFGVANDVARTVANDVARVTSEEGGAGERGAAPLTSDADDAVRLQERLESTWQEYLAQARLLLDEGAEQNRCTDPARLIDGILAACRFVPALRPVDVRAARPAQIQLARGPEFVFAAVLGQSHHRSLGLVLAKLSDLSAQHEVLAIRETAHDLPPTWSETLQRRSVLLANPKARWFNLGREEAARLLALDELLRAARSRDVTDPKGADVDENVVHDWVTRTLDVANWDLLRALQDGPETRPAASTPEPPRASSESPPLPNGNRPLSNGSSPLPNSQLSPLPNGQLSPLPNGQLSLLPNGQLPPLPNGQLSPLPNGQLPPLPNGQLPPLPNTPLPPRTLPPRTASTPPPRTANTPTPPRTASTPPPPPTLPTEAAPPRPASKPPRGPSAPQRSAGEGGPVDEPAGLGRPPNGVVLAILTRLRLASVERLVREVLRVDPAATRASIMSELAGLSPRVHWIGRSIVHLRDEET